MFNHAPWPVYSIIRYNILTFLSKNSTDKWMSILFSTIHCDSFMISIGLTGLFEAGFGRSEESCAAGADDVCQRTSVNVSMLSVYILFILGFFMCVLSTSFHLKATLHHTPISTVHAHIPMYCLYLLLIC